MATAHDPIEFELFKNALFAIADEMALTIFRTTYSGVLKDNMDYSTAFRDVNGKLMAQVLTLPHPTRSGRVLLGRISGARSWHPS
jgi:N-methylhydantoinase B